MKLAAENLHVISKSTKDALISRDESYIKELIKKMAKKNGRLLENGAFWYGKPPFLCIISPRERRMFL